MLKSKKCKNAFFELIFNYEDIVATPTHGKRSSGIREMEW
jgi:hypothetical protein